MLDDLRKSLGYIKFTSRENRDILFISFSLKQVGKLLNEKRKIAVSRNSVQLQLIMITLLCACNCERRIPKIADRIRNSMHVQV